MPSVRRTGDIFKGLGKASQVPLRHRALKPRNFCQSLPLLRHVAWTAYHHLLTRFGPRVDTSTFNAFMPGLATTEAPMTHLLWRYKARLTGDLDAMPPSRTEDSASEPGPHSKTPRLEISSEVDHVPAQLLAQG